jgi:hypothetical protein
MVNKKCLSVFSSTVPKHKNYNIQEYNFAFGSVWVFENRVLRRIFGSKRNEVMGGWRKLHNEDLRDLYSLPSITRMVRLRNMRLAEHIA